jgi:hypothetical protein
MNNLTPEQLKRIDTRAQRQRYKDTDGEEGKLSLYIRIGTCRFRIGSTDPQSIPQPA